MTHTRSRALLTAFLAVSIATVLAACGSAPLPSPGGGQTQDAFQQAIDSAPVANAADIPPGSEMAKIRAAGVLAVGGTDQLPLFSLKDPITGKLTGFDAGLSQMLAKYIIGKPNTKLAVATADTREALLQNGSVNVVFSTYSITPARAQKVAFAGPYYSSGDAIMVKKANSDITKPADLNGKTVCTETNSTAANDVKQFAPGANVILFQQNSQCEQAVAQGRADAYVLDQAILLGDASRDSSVKVVGTPFTNEPYGIGVPQSSPEMKAFVNNWLKTIEADGAWAKMWQATVGTALSGPPPAPPAIGSVPGT